MGAITSTLSSIVFSLVLVSSLLGIVFASPTNWVEVTRFAGKVDIASLSGRVLNVDFTTESFICNNVEWRIRWNFSPAFVYGGGGERRSGLFLIDVYQNNTDDNQVNSIDYVGREVKNGTWVHNENGIFHLHISTLFAYEYSIIVEQNINSIPEFQSWIPFLILISSTVVITILKKQHWKEGIE